MNGWIEYGLKGVKFYWATILAIGPPMATTQSDLTPVVSMSDGNFIFILLYI